MIGSIHSRGNKRLFVAFGSTEEWGVVGDAEPGAVVRVRKRAPLSAEVAETLATPDSVLALLYRAADRVGVAVSFPDKAFAQAKERAELNGAFAGLEDLSRLPFVTIDYPTSQDLDQAVFIEKGDDGYTVYYALADAAHFVEPSSPLLAEALRRGTSYYAPGLMIPMLPACLSEDAVSINEGVDRRAFTFRIELDRDGVVRASTILRSKVRSRAKLSYSGVQEFLDGPSRHPFAGRDFANSLLLLRDVGKLRISLSIERDVVRFDRVASRMRIAADGHALVIEASPRNLVQKYNEQISLLCNTEGARLLAEKSTIGIYRVHQPPEPDVLDDFTSQIDSLVVAHGLGEEWRWRRDQGEPLSIYIDRLPDEGNKQRLACALQRQAMMLTKASFYALEPGPHYGIGASSYSRFSAPMREIVGVLSMHLALGEELAEGICEQAVESANRAKSVQKRLKKEAVRIALHQLFEADIAIKRDERPRRVGTVMGMTSGKIYVQLDDPSVEVKLYLPDLQSSMGQLELSADGHELRSPSICLRLGDALELVARQYEKKRDRWTFHCGVAPGD